MTSIEMVRERLSEIRAVNGKQDIVSAGMVRAVDLRDAEVIIRLAPGALPPASMDVLAQDIQRAVGALDGVQKVRIQIEQTPGQQSAGGRASPYGELGPI